MTLKVRILRCLRRLFIILVSLIMTRFSEKMLISTRFINGFMSNLIKKSWTDSILPASLSIGLLSNPGIHEVCNCCKKAINSEDFCAWIWLGWVLLRAGLRSAPAGRRRQCPRRPIVETVANSKYTRPLRPLRPTSSPVA